VFGREITADSSRHIRIGAGGGDLNTYLREVGQRSSKSGRTVSPHIHLIRGCACSICKAIRYDYVQDHTRFLQTHSFNALLLSQTNSREIAKHYLNGVPVPFYHDMTRAIEILQQPKSKTKETLLAVGSAKKMSHGLFGNVRPDTKTLDQLKKVLIGYAKYHKKPVSSLQD
jgi:hypothetical protein